MYFYTTVTNHAKTCTVHIWLLIPSYPTLTLSSHVIILRDKDLGKSNEDILDCASCISVHKFQKLLPQNLVTIFCQRILIISWGTRHYTEIWTHFSAAMTRWETWGSHSGVSEHCDTCLLLVTCLTYFMEAVHSSEAPDFVVSQPRRKHYSLWRFDRAYFTGWKVKWVLQSCYGLLTWTRALIMWQMSAGWVTWVLWLFISKWPHGCTWQIVKMWMEAVMTHSLTCTRV